MRELSRVVPLLLLTALSPGGAGCAGGEPRIELHAPEAHRSSMFGGACSIFLEIRNPGSGADALLDAKVDVPGAVAEIHEVRDGRMVRSRKVPVPAQGSVTLRPGGLHIMVFNLPRELGAGAELTLRLAFERSGEKRTSVRIHG